MDDTPQNKDNKYTTRCGSRLHYGSRQRHQRRTRDFPESRYLYPAGKHYLGGGWMDFQNFLLGRIITHILKKNMQITGNHQMARIVRHNDESVRVGYIRNGGKEVKLFTSALKAFQCNNRIVMAQRKHLDDFCVVELLDDWNVDVPSWKYPRNLESPRVSSPGFSSDSKMMVM
ncbi:uncharacterized protein TNCV_4539191 [Trichonephila clavipes]|nr:uncharacterized protein TNCV_4539191 [Trichonephila clavipes]